MEIIVYQLVKIGAYDYGIPISVYTLLSIEVMDMR